MLHRGVWLVACFALVWAAGCEDERPEEQPIVAEEGEPAPGALKGGAAPRGEEGAAQPAGPVARGDSFELRLAGEKAYAVSELSQFTMTLKGRGEWHVNLEFPFRAEVKAADPVKLPKGALEKEDAVSFKEEGAQFDVPFTPEGAGEHRVEVDVSFAMCTPETCVPESAKVALVLPVK